MQKLVDLTVGDDEKSAIAQAEARPEGSKPPAPARPLVSTSRQSMMPLEERARCRVQIRRFCKLLPV